MARQSPIMTPTGVGKGATVPQPDDKDGKPEIDAIRINFRVLLLTVVLGAAAGTVVYFQHEMSVQRNADYYLKEANKAEEAGDASAAIEGLTRYLQFQSTAVAGDDDANVTDALVRLSKLLKQEGVTAENARHVFSVYESTLRRDPSNQQVRRQAIDLCMEIGRYRDAILHIEYLRKQVAEESPSAPDAPAVWEPAELALIAGLAHTRLSEYKQAQLAYLSAISESPADPLPYARLAMVIAARPQDLCVREDLDDLNGPLALELKSLFPESAGPAELATIAAVGVHRLATEHAQPKWMVWRNAAEFVMALGSPDDRAAAPRTLADRVAADLIRLRDADMDGSLSPAESHTAEVPPCSDIDFDGKITQSELSGYLTAGDRWGRLEGAQYALRRAAGLVPPEETQARGAVLLSQLGLNLVMANVADTEQRSDGPEFLASARAAAEDGLKLNLQWPEFLDGLARVEQQTVETEKSIEVRSAHLDVAEKHLRDAIELMSASDDAQTGGSQQLEEVERLRGARKVTEVELLWRLAEMLSQRAGHMADSEAEKVQKEIETEILPRMKELGVSPVYSDLVQARLLILDQQWRQAEVKLAQLERQTSPTAAMHHEIQLQRAFCADKLGNPDAQVELARSAVADNPMSGMARLLLGQGLLRLGRIDEAVNELRLASGVPGGAEQFANALVVQQLRKPFRERSWEQVGQVLDMIENRSGPDSDVVTMRAELAFAEAIAAQQEFLATEEPAAATRATSKVLESQNLLEQQLSKTPDDVNVRVALVNHFLRRFDKPAPERFERCEQLLLDAPPAVAGSVKLKLAAASVAQLLPKEEAIPWLEEIESSAGELSVEERYQLKAGLAKAFLGLEETDQSLQAWEDAAALAPTEVVPLLAQLQILLVQFEQNGGTLSPQHERTWSNVLLDLEKLEGKGGPNGSFFIAAMEVLQFVRKQANGGSGQDALKTLEDPRRLLEQVTRQRPYWAAPQRFLAEIQALAGNTESAILYLEKAVSLGDRSESVIAQLARYYVAHGKQADADRVLSLLDAQAVESLSEPAAQLALRVADRNQQYDRAIELLRGISRRDPTAESAVLLAVMMFRQNTADPEVEKKSREAAYEKWPESPEVWQWLVRYYSAMGRFEDARRAILDSQSRIAPEPAWKRSATIGSCYETLATADAANAASYLEQAEKFFQKALEEDPNAGRVAMTEFYIRRNMRDKALASVRALLDPKMEVPANLRFWAQHREALVVASSGVAADLESALNQLDRMRPDNDVQKIELLRAKSAVYFSRNLASDRKDLIAVLESLRDLVGERLGERERLQLALLYESDERYDDAEQTYQALLEEANAESAQALAALAALLIRKAETLPQSLDEASLLLGRLRNLEPDTLRTVSTSAKLLVAQGRLQLAVDELVSFARRRVQEHRAGSSRSNTAAISDPQVLLNALKEIPELQTDRIARALLQRAEYSLGRGEDEQALALLKQIDAAKQVTDELRLEAVRMAAQMIEGFSAKTADPQSQPAKAALKSAEDLYRLYAANTSRAEAKLTVPIFLGRQKRYDEALAACESLAATVPVEQVGAVAMAILREHTDKLKEHGPAWAARLVETLEQNDPDRQYKQYLLLGDFYVMLERYQEATQVYAQVLKLKEDDLVALNNLAWLYGRLGMNLEQALKYIQTVIDKYGAAPELVDTQAVVLIALGRNDMALAALQALPDQNAAKLLMRKAEVYWRMGRKSEARDAAQKALDGGLVRSELDPFDEAILEAIEAGSPLVHR